MEGEAPSEYTGDPCSFTGNVKRVLIHGLSWYQFYILISGETAVDYICKAKRSLILTSVIFVNWRDTGLYQWKAFSLGVFTAFWQEETDASLTTEWGCGQSTPFKRWRPFGPHPMACWVGDTLVGRRCGRCQGSNIDLREIHLTKCKYFKRKGFHSGKYTYFRVRWDDWCHC